MNVKAFRNGSIVIAVLCVVAGVGLLTVQVDTRHEKLLDRHTQAATAYENFIEEFGSDEIVIVALSGEDLFAVEALDTMLETLDRLESIETVAYVGGIPAVFRDRFGAEDPEALEFEMTTTPFYEGLFLSEDHEAAGLVVQTEGLDSPDDRETLVAGIREAVAPLEEYGFRVDLVGIPVFDLAINDMSTGETIRMFPAAAVASLIVLILLLRSLKATVVVLICGLVTLLPTARSRGPSFVLKATCWSSSMYWSRKTRTA